MNLIINEFKSLNSFNDIAKLLNVSTGFLRKILIENKTKNYSSFNIPKKNGELRTIHKPDKNLLSIQVTLKEILESNFNSHSKAHGFIKNKDFISNASQHIKKRYVLNLDLEEFFNSISFRRVRHIFIAYFKFNDKVSSTLANICCHPDGFLPQGAPTSPIISNIIAKTLDNELTNLAKKCSLTYYSRYADDITFSSNMISFPSQIASLNQDREVSLSPYLINIINKNGFNINEQKIRLQNYQVNQTVTGITVNKKVNLNRRYIKRIRAILHSFESNSDNPQIAIRIFQEKYKSQILNEKFNNPEKMYYVLKGMILHVAHVRGKNDEIFKNFAIRFNTIAENLNLHINPINIPPSIKEYYEKNVFVIAPFGLDNAFYMNEKNELDEMCYGQGTAFYLKDIGLVTNYHVIDFLIEEVIEKNLTFAKPHYIEYYSESENPVQNSAKILYYNKLLDIAILEPEHQDLLDTAFEYNLEVTENKQITLIGFPEHEQGTSIRIQPGRIVRKRKTNNNVRYEITPTIFAGNSGGPVLNHNNEVIGVAVRGATERGIVPSEFIPIKEAVFLFENNQE